MKKIIKITNFLLLFSFIAAINAFGQNSTQNDINNAALGTKDITIDGYVWRVAIRKTHTDGKKYAMLYATMGSPHQYKRFGANNVYNSSEVRTSFNNEYAKSASFTTLKQIAVVPTMNNGTGLTNTARTALPTNPQLASTNGTTQDVLFLPTMQDVKDWQSTWNVAGTFPKTQRLMTRNPYQTSPNTVVCGFNTSDNTSLQDDAGLRADNANSTGILQFRPCIWVMISAIEYAVIYDGNGNTGGTAPNGGAYSESSSVTIAGQGTLTKEGYAFVGWKYGETIYQPGYNTFIMPVTTVTFVAQWKLLPTSIVTNKNITAKMLKGNPCESNDCSKIDPTKARITAYTNVMYDFQHQELEAYVIAGGQPIAWQWQVSTTQNGTYYNIPTSVFGARTAKLTVPANVIHNASALGLPDFTGMVNDELFFRCKLTNPNTPAGTVQTNTLGIEFIKTKDNPKYVNEGGVRYLEINRGGTINGGKIKIALTNLGASENDNAGDLGDFYQWGRKADGHQTIVWSKGTDDDRSYVISHSGTYPTGSASFETNGQVSPGNAGYGKFITTGNTDWSTQAANTRWGNNSDTRAGASLNANAITSSNTRGWIYPESNPCAALGSGWRVPSIFEQWDMYRGNGSTDSPGFITTNPYNPNVAQTGSGNIYRWRPASDNNVVGGVIVSLPTGEKIFLPAVGYRDRQRGDIALTGSYGLYWSSTSQIGGATSARNSSFQIDRVGIDVLNYRSSAFSVRCVKE